jgi:hypothetical protein
VIQFPFNDRSLLGSESVKILDKFLNFVVGRDSFDLPKDGGYVVILEAFDLGAHEGQPEPT